MYAYALFCDTPECDQYAYVPVPATTPHAAFLHIRERALQQGWRFPDAQRPEERAICPAHAAAATHTGHEPYPPGYDYLGRPTDTTRPIPREM